MDLIVFEDEHLLVVNKPAGVNTHSPTPFGLEGIYEWLRNRKPEWAKLAIIHRLDKETSGLMVFGKTPLANRSLTGQFATRKVHKKYIFQTDRSTAFQTLTAKSCWARVGDRYVSRPIHPTGDFAETHFRRLEGTDLGGGEPGGSHLQLVEAMPVTGRTHQIRVHAAEHGFAILGDVLYGGTPAERVCLHAAELSFRHPASGKELVFRVAPDFGADPRLALRDAFIDLEETNAYRVIHGAADGWPGLFVDRFDDYLLAQSERGLDEAQRHFLSECLAATPEGGLYHKILRRQIQKSSVEEASPQWVAGKRAPEEILVRENGIQYGIRLGEGYSMGLFLDQRENRRRLLRNWVAPDFGLFGERPEVLNAFAYTCGFSVCAAKAGARVTSLDLSKKYLDWGRRNFLLNGLAPEQHDFIFGEAFDWFGRLGKKSRLFDLILLDPPTFSRAKEGGVFQAEKDYGKLVKAALPLLRPGGVLFASTNAAMLKPEEFLKMIRGALAGTRRGIIQEHYVPQPPDFPSNKAQAPYLKTIWLRLR